MTRHRGSAGFSLIELLVVIAVLAIIAAISIPYVRQVIREGRRSRATADLEALRDAIVDHTRETGYPTPDDEVADRKGDANAYWEGYLGDYIDRVPEDDPWENAHSFYYNPDSGERAFLMSNGPDGVNESYDGGAKTGDVVGDDIVIFLGET